MRHRYPMEPDGVDGVDVAALSHALEHRPRLVIGPTAAAAGGNASEPERTSSGRRPSRSIAAATADAA